MKVNPRRFCPHDRLTVTAAWEVPQVATFVGRVWASTVPGVAVPTGRKFRVCCPACGLDRTFACPESAPQWVRALVEAAPGLLA